MAYNKGMKINHDHKISPADVSPEILKQLDQILHAQRTAILIGPDGDRMPLPPALSDLFQFVVDAMKRKQVIVMLPEDEALTTHVAANFLGMSRPYILRLLDAGAMPFHRVGTHRRIKLSDLVEYQKKRNKERKAILDQMTSKLDEAGVYDRF
jgi:excisionase family DNA binding protein